MKYTIKVNELKNNEGKVKALATVVFGDSFKVGNIAIVEGKDGNVFVSMPRFKSGSKDKDGNDVYKDICNPITREFREELYANILETYEKEGDKEMFVRIEANEEVEMPQFTVSVTPYEKENSNIRGLARIYIEDSFIINNVTLVQGKNDVFVAMPSYKTKQTDEQGKAVYQEMCYPVSKEFREKLYGELIGSYNYEKKKQTSKKEENNSVEPDLPIRDSVHR